MLSSVQLFVTPWDCRLPGSSVHGIFQARILEWVAISSLMDLPDPGIEPKSHASPTWANGYVTTLPHYLFGSILRV